MENKNNDKPVLIFQSVETLKKPFKLHGEGEDCFFNTLQYLRFKGDWWLVKLEIRNKTQTYAAIVIFIDMFGNIRFSKDNIFSISEEDAKELILIIGDYINPEKKEINLEKN